MSMIGKEILHYHLLKKLGEGGMGVVYLAEDTRLERKVAIKFLPHHIAGNTEERLRFENEAKAAAALNHPNIATMHAIEHADDELFLVMEFVDGHELKELISEKQYGLSEEEALNYAAQIAAGLQVAHDKGITHRDIKSGNIMVTKSGSIKLMDFGLAKFRNSAQLTQIGTTIGTAAYMSPEQAKGTDVDQRSDIWSFGIVLYEMLTGQLPFRGAYEQAIIYSILNEAPDPVSISPRLSAIIEKCLQKDIADRYQSMTELLEDLRTVANDPQTVETESFARQQRKHRERFPKRNRVAFLLFAGLLSLIIMFAAMPFTRDFSESLFNSNSKTTEHHLLILPLKNVGSNPENQPFCDGLMETLSSKLTQLEQFQGELWVVPASEVLQHDVKSAGKAYQLFGANLAVTGSLQILNDLFRLTINLVDAKNVRQLNSAIIDVKVSEISSLQNRAVIKLMEMLHIELEQESRDVLMAGNTNVPEAYEYYIRGKGYLQRYENTDNIEEALRLFKMASESDPDYALAFAGLGEAYWRYYETTKKPGLAELALTAGEKAFQLDSLLAQVNVTLGIIYSGVGRYENSIDHFARALLQSPSNAAAYRGQAKAYEALDKISEAEKTFKRAIKLKPGYWAGYNNLGAFYFRHSRYEDAVDQFKKVIELTPDNFRGYNNLGGIYYMLERWSDAREMFEKSLAIRKSYSIFSNLGTLYYIEGKYEKAAVMYEQALEENDNDYLTWGNLAAAYSLLDSKQEQAMQTYRKAIAIAEKQLNINPNAPDVISNLASYYADVGDSSKAVTLIEQAIRKAPDDIQVMYRAGSTYEHLGNREKALHWIGRALKNGYSKSEIEHQPELAQLVADERYKQLTGEY
ncbi:protein kinase [candidate division KSB1 bacterium]|nr:protein kinase [candidate division KSB1 bacterium]